VRRPLPALPLVLGVLLVAALVLVLVLIARPDGDGSADRRPDPPAPPSAGPSARAADPTADLTTVLSSGFDEDQDGWQPLGEAVDVQRVQDVTHAGAGSLRITGRTEAWHGAAVDVSGVVAPGSPHTVTAWVRTGSGTADVQLTLERDPDGDPVYLHLDPVAATADRWTQVVGTVDVPAGDGPWRLYVETTGALVDLRLDDVTVSRPSPPVQTDVPALREVAPFPVGTAVGPQDLTGRPAELLARHFDQVTPENAMKPITVQPAEGRFDFGPMDQVLDAAVSAGQTVHGHTLVWYRSTPDWFFQRADGTPLTGSDEDRALLLGRLETHLRAIADHLAERYGTANPVRSWDVVNEALDPEQDDGLRRSRWYQVLGPDYVAEAFRLAREVFGPDVALYLNDYETDVPDRRRALVALVQDLLAAGVPIDGVGHQMHLRLGASADRIDQTLDAVGDLGVAQAVTELDLALSSRDEHLDATPPDRVEQQGAEMEALLRVIAAHDPAFVSVWGLYDTRSWLRTWPRERPFEAPLLFDGDLQAKPAFWGFVRGIEGAPG
jgi:endo-1,4-beta-xylanase